MRNILELENISKTYYTKEAETLAVDGLSFTVKQEEFVALLGPSGCGKTTLLSLISGNLPPTGGEIRLMGKPVKGISNEIGYMLQHDHLFEWRTIRRNVNLGLEIRHILTKENTSYTDELMTKYGLKEFADSYPHTLSGGMRQRAALIRTLALSPQILLLDEPFSALDFQTRLQVCDDVYKIIKQEKKTTLLVTHDISEAISLADKIIVLTDRPAKVKNIHYPLMSHISSPLKRREDASFAKQFEQIWKELNNE